MFQLRNPAIRRAISVFVALCLINVSAHAKYSGGTGEPNDPYQIATAADLIALGQDPNDYDKHFILTADIDLDPKLPGRRVFDKAVIGSFTGIFDGNGHTISHLTIKGKDYVGLFGQLSGEVKSVGVVDVNTTASRDNVGGLVGESYYGNVVDCHSTGVVCGTGSHVGGLVGYNKGVVTHCYNTGMVSSSSCHIGGLVGYNEGYVIDSHNAGAVSTSSYGIGGLAGYNEGGVSYCYNYGPVTGRVHSVGGLVGFNVGYVTNCHSTGAVGGVGTWTGGLVGDNGGTLAGCYSTGTVTTTGSGVGGLVGINSQGPVIQCYSTSAVSGEHSVGGLVGYNENMVTYCYSAGAVSGTGPGVGGLVGDNGSTVTNCYSTGAVSSFSNNVGGLVGHNDSVVSDCYSTGTVTGIMYIVGGLVGWDTGSVGWCFWDTEASGQPLSDGGTGKTTTEMRTSETFLDAGWDFVGEAANGTDDIWWIDEGKTYPKLRWEHAVLFPDYVPLTPAQHGVQTFQWTYGRSGQFTCQIGGTKEIPYADGTVLTGTEITYTAGFDRTNDLGYNDGSVVKFLGTSGYFFSVDPLLTSHPVVWSFGSVFDGMLVDQRPYYSVQEDRSQWSVDDTQMVLFEVQDVTVAAGTYAGAVIMWILDTRYPFMNLDLAHWQARAGVILPTRQDTRGFSVTAFNIYGFRTGLIATGDIDARTGKLNTVAELSQILKAP